MEHAHSRARRRFGARVCALLAAAALAACSSPGEAPIARGATVLVLGDSISAGYGLRPDQSWVAHLGALAGWQVVNAGVSGDTSAQALARLPALLDAHRPAAVLIELGGNDMLRKLPTSDLTAALSAIVDHVREAGARPVLLAVPVPNVAGAVFRNLSDHALYAQLAEAKRVPLVDEAIADVLSRAEWKLDALHPNADGHRELAGRVAKKLRALGLLRKE